MKGKGHLVISWSEDNTGLPNSVPLTKKLDFHSTYRTDTLFIIFGLSTLSRTLLLLEL